MARQTRVSRGKAKKEGSKRGPDRQNIRVNFFIVTNHSPKLCAPKPRHISRKFPGPQSEEEEEEEEEELKKVMVSEEISRNVPEFGANFPILGSFWVVSWEP